MPAVATFVSIQDENVIIPPEEGLPINDIHRQFNAPGLAGPGLLLFRLTVLEPCTFSFSINEAPTLSHNLQPSSSRSFHELYPLSTLREDGNQLTMVVRNGRVVVSDIVFLYQVRT